MPGEVLPGLPVLEAGQPQVRPSVLKAGPPNFTEEDEGHGVRLVLCEAGLSEEAGHAVLRAQGGLLPVAPSGFPAYKKK